MNTVEDGFLGTALFSFVTQHTGAFFLIFLAVIVIAALTITWVVRRVKRETRQYVQNGRKHLHILRSDLNQRFRRTNSPRNMRPKVTPEFPSHELAADLKEAPRKFKNVHHIR